MGGIDVPGKDGGEDAGEDEVCAGEDGKSGC